MWLRSFMTMLVIIMAIFVECQGYWLRQRDLQWPRSMKILPQSEVKAIKKAFLPPRYQNLWGKSSKVVESSALAPQNMDDYKMPTQQKMVFSWQPTNSFNDW